MTDNEIIKDMETCIKYREERECGNCSRIGRYQCAVTLMQDAFDLIKRLKAENNDLFYKLQGVMLSVDKWLEDEELKQDEVNRAAKMRKDLADNGTATGRD